MGSSLTDLSEWSIALQEEWRQIFLEQPGLACVDFDNTMVRGDYGEQIMEWLLARHYPLADGLTDSPSLLNLSPTDLLDLWGWNYNLLFRDPELARKIHTSRDPRWRDFVFEEYGYVRETRGLGESYRWSSFLFSGWREVDFRALAREIWLENLDTYKKNPSHYKSYPLPYPMMVHPREPLLQTLQHLKSLGWRVNIVTASPVVAVEETTPELGLEKSDVIGMRLELNSLGRTKSTILEPYPYGIGKVEAIRNKHSQSATLSFGDTVNDLPMLQSATRLAVLFQRGYTDLNQEAEKSGIHIEEWI